MQYHLNLDNGAQFFIDHCENCIHTKVGDNLNVCKILSEGTKPAHVLTVEGVTYGTKINPPKEWILVDNNPTCTKWARRNGKQLKLL